MDFAGTKPTRVGRTTYTYDDAGRVVRTVTKRLSRKPLVHEFFYATSEQPIGFISSDNKHLGWRYIYDPYGRRVAKEAINTTTGEVTHRTVFAHVGNQLVAEAVTHTTNHTTVGDAVDYDGVATHLTAPDTPGMAQNVAGNLGDGYLWTTDPATGDIIGQTRLTHTTNNPYATATHGGGHPENNLGDVDTVEQALVDAQFFVLVTDLAGSPQDIINPTTGDIAGLAHHSLYGTRTWTGEESSPLLFAGQYLDNESGWAYNRYRYYHPNAGIYNAQDPLGLAPRTASAQGYVDHAAFWVDIFGLLSHVKNAGLQKQIDNLTPNQKGQLGEALAKEKFTGQFDELTPRSSYRGASGKDRISDITLMNDSIVESKFVKSQGLSSQIRDGIAQAKSNDAAYHLVTAPETKLSGPLKEAISRGDVIHHSLSEAEIARALA